MSKVQTTIMMDAQIRKSLQELAKKLGVSMSALLNIAASNMVHRDRESILDETYETPAMRAAYDEAMEDLKNGETVSLDDFMKERGITV